MNSKGPDPSVKYSRLILTDVQEDDCIVGRIVKIWKFYIVLTCLILLYICELMAWPQVYIVNLS